VNLPWRQTTAVGFLFNRWFDPCNNRNSHFVIPRIALPQKVSDFPRTPEIFAPPGKNCLENPARQASQMHALRFCLSPQAPYFV
jgi:hypothetical protein